MPTFVAVSTVALLSTTGQATYPVGIAAGDLLLLCAQSDDPAIACGETGFAPVTDALTGGGGTVRMWAKAADGTEAGSVTVTTPAGTRGVVVMAAYRPAAGMVVASVADASAVDTDTSSSSFSATGPTLDVLDGDLLIFWSMFVATGGTFTAGASGITTAHPASGTNASRANGRSGGNLIQYNLRERTFTAAGSGAPTVTATGVGAPGTSGPSNMVAFRDVADAPPEPATGSASGLTTWTGTVRGPMPRGFSSVAEMLATPGFTVAHRGNSTQYAEGSLFAYDQAVARGYGALEISLACTSDGVWFALHDQTLLRTSGVDLDPADMTWEQVQAYQITNAADGVPRPYMPWFELLTFYRNTHVFFVDPKHTDPAHRDEFLDILDYSLGPTRAVVKYFGTNTSLAAEARARGYQTWGYFYAAQIDGGSWSTQQAAWTMLGIEWNETPARYSKVLGEGKPVIGHVVTSQFGYDTAISKGADGVMVGGTDVVAAVGAGPGGAGTGTATWTGAATGARPSQGAASGTTTWSGTAVGPALPPVPVVPVTAYLPPGPDPLTTHRVESWWVDLLDSDDAPLGTLDGVTGGSVEQNVHRVISGGGTLDVTDRGQGVDWLSARVQVWWQVAGVDPWPLGVYLCSAPVAAYSDGGISWRVELLDKLLVLDEDKVDGSYSVAAGAVVTAAVRAVIASSGETAVAVTDSTETLAAGMVWPAGTSKLRIINDLLASINYFSLRCDGYGRYVAAPYQSPASRPVVREFVAGSESIHLPDFTRDQDLAGIPNKVVLVSSGRADAEALVGVASNTDPSSPTSQPSRGRWIVHSEDGVEATSQAVINALAARRLTDLSTVTATDAIAHAAVPLNLNDVVRLTSGGLDATAAVQSWSLNLEPGSLMRTEIREVLT